mgnify:CR=1 FL=1
MSEITAETSRPVKRKEVSKLRWTWEEMKNNKIMIITVVQDIKSLFQIFRR